MHCSIIEVRSPSHTARLCGSRVEPSQDSERLQRKPADESQKNGIKQILTNGLNAAKGAAYR